MERLENRQMMAADLGSLEFVVAAEGEAEEGRSYYVNDEATAGDVYSTAAGSNSSDGLSPAAPMASLGGLLRRYDLEPGDTVFVDTGRYELLKNIDITREDSGVRIVGAPTVEQPTTVRADPVLADNPLAFWRFGETTDGIVRDVSGNGLDAMPHGEVSVGQLGVSEDGATLIDGVDAFYTIPGTDSSLSGNAAPTPEHLTIEAWVKPTGSMNALGWSIVRNFGFDVYYQSGGQIKVDALGIANWDLVTPIEHDQWSHIAVTFDGVTTRLFVNGELADATEPPFVALPSHAGDITIGRFNNLTTSPERHWRGSLDEVALYDYALSPERIRTHFEQASWSGTVLDRGNTETGSYVFELNGVRDVTLENLEISGAEVGIAIGQRLGEPLPSVDRLTIRNLDIHSNAIAGIRVYGGDNAELTITRSSIHGNQTGMLLEPTLMGSGYNITYGTPIAGGVISENRIYSNAWNGVDSTYASQLTIRDNYFAWNATGVRVSGWRKPADELQKNIIAHNVAEENGYGIVAYSHAGAIDNRMRVIDNSVLRNADIGIQLVGYADAVGNNVTQNRIGIQQDSASGFGGDGVPIVVRDNTVNGNQEIGIKVLGHSQVTHNRVYSSETGIVGAYAYKDPDSPDLRIANNVIFDSGSHGIRLEGTQRAQVANNTIYEPIADAIAVTARSKNVTLENNILWTRNGYNVYVENDSQDGFAADYNLHYATGGGVVGHFTTDVESFGDWQVELGFDEHGKAADPRFVNPSGADGLLGLVNGIDGGMDADFHLSPESPGVDMGSPESDYSNEPRPNGNRINVGAYGNTPDATLSSALETPPWQNPVEPLDSNNDGVVAPIDVLIIINEINSNGSRALTGSQGAIAVYYDTNGDGFISPGDVLVVINHLNRSVAAEGEDVESVVGALSNFSYSYGNRRESRAVESHSLRDEKRLPDQRATETNDTTQSSECINVVTLIKCTIRSCQETVSGGDGDKIADWIGDHNELID
jgi:hypothetical protein